ncbi:MAG: winged helix DNA-binding domain-containing protein [Propionibacteriaceae bacterium]|nr:winged helix DNA-binding domain-containing protein [Propionibacteriaceae bacterium]
MTGERAVDPAGVAQRFLALQAQDFPASQWALGVRSGATLAEVEQVYQDGRVVRSWPLRGTLHACPAEDVGWLQRLTSAKALGASAQRRRDQLGLDLRLIEQVRERAVAVLAGGRALGREALLAEVADRGVELLDHWKYHLIWFLAQTGTLLFGPVADGEPLLVLADEWVAQPRQLGREEGLAELVARYLAAHGPARLEDMTWWSGLGKREIQAGLTLAGDRVIRVEAADGTAHWMTSGLADGTDEAGLANDSGAVAGPSDDTRVVAGPPTVELLPAFDELLLGYRDRSLTLDPAQAPLICPGGNGIFKPVVLVDGVCAGTWRPLARGALKRLPQDKPVPIAVSWFDQAARRSADPALLAEAADRYARYLGRERASVTVAAA